MNAQELLNTHKELIEKINHVIYLIDKHYRAPFYDHCRKNNRFDSPYNIDVYCLEQDEHIGIEIVRYVMFNDIEILKINLDHYNMIKFPLSYIDMEDSEIIKDIESWVETYKTFVESFSKDAEEKERKQLAELIKKYGVPQV